MAELYIEDKYYEAKLDDGTVVFTRTRYIVNALKYYRNQCLEIIKLGENKLKQTPRMMMVESFEEAKRKMDSITNTQIRIRKAYDMIDKIDEILRKMATNNPPSGPQK